MTLTVLAASTTYHYRAKSGDAFGNLAVSSDFTFSTGGTAPPVMSNGSPSGTLPAGTASATLSVSTNTTATCAYSTADVAYGSMTLFTTSGGLTHSTMVSGLTNGASYTYYVRCRDTSGNTDTSSLVISFTIGQTAVVATPTISPNGGTANTPFTVTLSTTTSGARIYYTTNNTPPTTGSTPYTGQFSVSATSIIQAVAAAPGMTNSAVASATFTIDTIPPVRSNGAPSGTLAAGTTSAILSLSTNEAATCAYALSDIGYASMSPFGSTGGLLHTTPVTGLTNGQSYGYYVRCRDAVGNVNTNSFVISFSLSLANVAAPAISPNGGFSISPFTVTLTSATPGASIYYTTDDTAPTTASTLYTAPFSVGTSSTVEALATAPGMINSSVTSAIFSVNTSVPSSGLKLWLKADAGVTQQGSSVSRWADQSANGIDATQSVAANQPTLVPLSLNGLPVLRFNGVNSFMSFTLPMNGLSGATLILISANSPNVDGNWNGSDNAALFWNETASWGSINLSPFQLYAKYRFGTTQVNNLPAYTRPRSIGNAPSLTTAIKDGANESLYVNGGLIFTQGGKLATIAGVQDTGNLGQAYENTYFAGDIAEVLIYNRALSDAERQQVEQYLLARYGIGQTPVISGIGVSNITVRRQIIH